MSTVPTDTPLAPTPAACEQALDWHTGDMPYSVAFDDHFYCRTDGRLECGHVFLAGNSLPARWQAGGDFAIGELGFGTGLNLCETWRQWTLTPKIAGARLSFTSFELYPMRRADIARALSAWPEIADQRTALLTHWPDAPVGRVGLDLAEDVRLTVVCGPALETLAATDMEMDAWFLDGFAPSRNPDMWSEALMAEVYRHTRPGGSFATYAAAGFVRRNLQAAGFTVSRSPGFAGKREMLSGVRPA